MERGLETPKMSCPFALFLVVNTIPHLAIKSKDWAIQLNNLSHPNPEEKVEYLTGPGHISYILTTI